MGISTSWFAGRDQSIGRLYKIIAHKCGRMTKVARTRRCFSSVVLFVEKLVRTTPCNASLRPKTAQYLFLSNCISEQDKFQLQFLLAWFSSPSHLAVVGERYHAFSSQSAIWPARTQPCAVILVDCQRWNSIMEGTFSPACHCEEPFFGDAAISL